MSVCADIWILTKRGANLHGSAKDINRSQTCYGKMHERAADFAHASGEKPIIQWWQLVSWCIAKCYPWVNAHQQQWMSVQIFDMWSDMIHWLTVLLLTCNTQNHPKDWPHSWITDGTPSRDAWTWPFHSWQSLTPVVHVTLSNGIKGNIFRSELTRHMDDVQLAPVQ